MERHSRSGKVIHRLQGQFNCWSTQRLFSLDLVKPSDIKALLKGKRFYPKYERDLSVIVHSPHSEYNLYVDIIRVGDSTPTEGAEILDLLHKVKLTGVQ